jgi:hypothetical protein
VKRLIVLFLISTLLTAITARSFFHTDRMALSRITRLPADGIAPGDAGWGLILRLHRGGVHFEHREAMQSDWSSRWVLPPPTGINSGFDDGRYDSTDSRPPRFSFAGIEYRTNRYSSGNLHAMKSRQIRLPLLLVAFNAVAVAMLGRQVILWRARRKNPHACAGCDYDLRASKDRCPECGRPISCA